MQKAARFLEEIMTDSLKQRRFVYHTLFTNWREIIGDHISALATPIRMKFSHRNDGAILTVKINSALGPEMQLRAPNIIERINYFYGRVAVKQIKFDVSHDLDLLGTVKKTKNEQIEDYTNGNEKIDSHEEEKFVIESSDPELRELLHSLQKNWFYRKKK